MTPAFVAYIPLYGESPAIICTDHKNIFMAIYGAEAFKNIKYDENGIATIMLPVIYKALGRAVEQSDKDETVIKKLIGCIPLTSLDFLYRGNKYFIPLSCNIDIDETPTENELIEITIRVFSPKAFRYSKKTIPYPYCIVESID